MTKLLISSGLGLIAAGLLWHFGLLKWVGKLPGDIRIERENFHFYFPLATCLILSILISLIFRLFSWFQAR